MGAGTKRTRDWIYRGKCFWWWSGEFVGSHFLVFSFRLYMYLDLSSFANRTSSAGLGVRDLKQRVKRASSAHPKKRHTRGESSKMKMKKRSGSRIRKSRPGSAPARQTPTRQHRATMWETIEQVVVVAVCLFVFLVCGCFVRFLFLIESTKKNNTHKRPVWKQNKTHLYNRKKHLQNTK